MAKYREGQSHRIVLFPHPIHITRSRGIPSQTAQQISRDLVHGPRAGSPAAGKAGPQKVKPHPHLFQEHIWPPMLPSPSEA